MTEDSPQDDVLFVILSEARHSERSEESLLNMTEELFAQFPFIYLKLTRVYQV